MKNRKWINIQLALVVFVLVLACTKSDKKAQENTGEVISIPEVASKIYLDIDSEELTGAAKGGEISVSLQDGSNYTLIINRIEETMPGIVSISADVENKETGQAVLILRDGKLTGSVNMYGLGMNYKLSYDEENARHYIIQIDPENRDVLQGGESIKAPNGG